MCGVYVLLTPSYSLIKKQKQNHIRFGCRRNKAENAMNLLVASLVKASQNG